MNINQYILSLVLVAVCFGCSQKIEKAPETLVNLAHLNHLYQEFNKEGEIYGIIRIYSDYPDYSYAWEKHEGIACVDDAARAAIVYLNDYHKNADTLSLKKCIRLIRFLLYMQADNGYFYNFLHEDHSINKSYHRSFPKPDWWSWRALWAITEAYPELMKIKPRFAAQLKTSINRLISVIPGDTFRSQEYYVESGVRLPKWLIYESGADQTAVLVMALNNYLNFFPDDTLRQYVQHMCQGIEAMQTGAPWHAFLSWKNIWHGWGSMPAYALLSVSKNFDQFIPPALEEIDHFYPYLIRQNYFAELEFYAEESKLRIKDEKKYPQIAYIIRPMVYATLAAYDLKKDERYSELAVRLAGWLFGANPANRPLYNPHNGRCFDGIESETKINMNSGAESTIEALLTLQAIEKYPGIRNMLREYLDTLVN